MKLLFSILISFVLITSLHADDKYEKAMKKNLQKMDDVKNAELYIEIANGFERIALAEKDKWLPYYYASFNYTLASFTDTLKEKKDIYLDKADKFINIADSIQPDESEIYTIKGMIAQARLQVDPMNRWQKYGAEADKNFKEAVKLDTLNPRPEYLIGVGIFYTPQQFGGGPAAAKPYLESSYASMKNLIRKVTLCLTGEGKWLNSF